MRGLEWSLRGRRSVRFRVRVQDFQDRGSVQSSGTFGIFPPESRKEMHCVCNPGNQEVDNAESSPQGNDHLPRGVAFDAEEKVNTIANQQRKKDLPVVSIPSSALAENGAKAENGLDWEIERRSAAPAVVAEDEW